MEAFSGSNDHLIYKGKRSKRPRPSSSASSSEISTCTEEDEDMAKCLILLARGVGVVPENKFSSRKFTEMTTTTTNGSKIGIYVYECKTCNRTFPSFQALGGHRASHKKPKTAADITDRKRSQPSDQEEEERQCTRVNITTIPPAPAINTFSNENKPKIHECSICGSEFASGQALGGHMRRHRPATAPTTNTNNNSTRIGTSMDTDSISSHDVGGKARSVMSLDLNLPAPPEEDCPEEVGFHHQFSSPRLVFSAAPLVDCHY